MKKSLLKIITISALFVVGASLTINVNKSPIQVEATPYLDDYDPYTYSGTYYDTIDFNAADGMDGVLRQTITSLIKPKDFYTYGSSGTNHLSTQLQYADEDPNNSANMIYLYTRDSVKKNAASSWNREHVWPQSLSNGNWGTSGGGTDVLHIRPTYNDTNNTRGNLLYGDNNKSGPLYYGNSNMLYGYTGGNYFEPLDTVKGDVARIIMYVWTAYTGYGNYNPLNILGVFQSYDTLLKWHTMDKPDMLEGNRNDYAQTSIQKNRNPFVDHPELAWRFFGNNASPSVKSACMEAYPLEGYNPDQKQLTSISISGQATTKDYYVGQSFDPTGLTVTAYYSDDSTKVVPNNSCTWTPDPLTEGTTSVTCKYGTCTAIYSGITVSKREGIGGEYTVEFLNTADSGTDINASNINTYIKTNTLFSSVSNLSKVFPGTYGLKLGSSSTNGSITFNLVNEAQADIIKVTIKTNGYNGNGSYTAKLGNSTIGSDISAGGTFTKDLSKTTATSLTINGNGRLYINLITLEIAAQDPGPSSSSEPISSSDPLPSSSEQASSSPLPMSSEEQQSSYEQPSQSCIDIDSSSAPDIESSEPQITSEIVDISEESEAPIEQSSVQEQSSSSEEPNPGKKKGCFGSAFGTLAILSITSLMGLVFVFSKKK